MQIIVTNIPSDAATLSVIKEVTRRVTELLEKGTIQVSPTENHRITGSITPIEAVQLALLILTHKPCTTLETGVGCGVSALAICTALAALPGVDRRHFGIDPCQFVDHSGAALALLARYNLARLFSLCPGATHLEAPALLKNGVTLDFAFIDGWHTFDYALIDFFYIDKMLRPGGIVAFHDATMPAIKKCLNFIRTHRRYNYLSPSRECLRTRLYYVLRCLRHADPFLGYALRGFGNLVCLQKTESYEPSWQFFRQF